MEIDLDKFQEYLVKKDKKNPYYRPLTSLPAERPRNFSDFQTRDMSIFRRPEKIGYTVRLKPQYQRTISQPRSSTIYDSSYLQEKSIKLKVTNDIGIKYLAHKPISNQSFYLKNLLTEKLKNTFQKDQNNPSGKKYQKKKLKVVKGKANLYKTKLKTGICDNQTHEFNPQKETINVAVIGTRLL